MGLILSFAAPLIIGDLLQQAYNLVDSAIVGHLIGADALASVGVCGSIVFLVNGFCNGLCSGFTVPIAQAFGAKDTKKIRETLFHCFFLLITMAIVVTGLCVIFTSWLLKVIDTPDDIYQNAFIYLRWWFYGIAFNLLYLFCASFLRALGDSRTPFIFLIVSAFLNVGLDLLCVAGLGLGVAGAAIATIASQGVSGILCLIFILIKHRQFLPGKDDRNFHIKEAGYLVRLGLPMGLQLSITAIGTMFMQAAINGLGSVYVSAITVGLRIKMFITCPFQGIGVAASIFSGQNFGAKRPDRIRKGAYTCLAIAVIYAAAMGVISMFLSDYIPLIFLSADETEVLHYAGVYLFRVAPFYWLMGVTIVGRMVLQGLGYSMRAFVAGIIEMAGRTVVSLWITPLVGFIGVCYTDAAAWLLAAVYIFPMMAYVVKNAVLPKGDD